MEETICGLFNLALVYTPSFTKSIKNFVFLVQHFNCSLSCNIVESDDTIRNSLTLDDSDPAYLSRVISMGTTTSLSVYASNIYYSKLVSWNNTSLIKTETILLFGLALIHETFSNFNTFADKSVCVIFYCLLLFLCQ